MPRPEWASLPVHRTPTEALRAVDDRRMHDVVQALLRTGPGAEPALADGLDLAPRFYLGPLVLPLELLRRCCGPEPGMAYPEPEDRWRPRVDALAALIEAGWEPPPLIYQPAADHLMDGNHRLAALLEVGRRRHPVLLVFDGEDERAAYATSSPPATPPRQAPDQRQDEVMSTSSGHPVAPSSTASVHTDRAARYGKQLVSHLGRRATAEWDEQAGTGWIDFGETRAELTAGPEALDIRLSADPDALARMEDVVGRHLVRFGARDELTVQWVRADGTRGTRQENTGE